MRNKSAVLFALGLVMSLFGMAHASANRGGKAMVSATQATTGVIISSGPAVLYSVIMGTGAVTDFVTIFDTNTTAALTSGSQLTGNFRMRAYPTSATANTQITFDPPLQFKTGIYVIPGTALGTAVFTWEPGRITQGY